jgi:hypothetical protein
MRISNCFVKTAICVIHSKKYCADFRGPASKLVLKFFLALWSALLGALFTFPGLRMAKMHWDTLRYWIYRISVQMINIAGLREQ